MTGDLLEREHELDRLAELAARARTGNGGGVLIEGPAGIGKTSLLVAARSSMIAEGILTLEASGGELERSFAYGVARQLLEPVLTTGPPARRAAALAGAGAVAAALVSASTTPAPSSPAAAAHALYWMVANLAAEQPLALLVDDAQWADEASLEWLVHLARRLAGVPVLIVATWRTGEPAAPELLADHLRRELTLLRPDALSHEAVRQLAQGDLGSAATERVSHECHRASGGNPFLLAALLRALASGAADLTEIEHVTLETVARSVRARIARLDVAAQPLAEAVAILGRDADLHHAAALARISPDEAVAAADALAAVGVFEADAPLGFVHPLVRAAIYGNVPAQRRAEAHRATARRLAHEGASIELIAVHLLASAPAGDPWVADCLQQAGHAALRGGAPAEAARLLDRARAEPPPAERRYDITHLLARAIGLTSAQDALPVFEEAAALAPDAVAGATSARELAACLLQIGHPAEALSVLDAHAPLVRELDRELHLAIEADRAAIGLTHLELARETGERLSTVAMGVEGRTRSERRLMACLAYHHALAGSADGPEAARLAALAVRSGDDLPEVVAEGASFLQALLVLLVTDHAAAGPVIDAGIAAAQRRGSPVDLAVLSTARCYQGWLRGDLAESEADGLVACANFAGVRITPVTYLARTLTDRGRPEEAEALLAPHDQQMQQTSFRVFRNAYLASLGHLRREQGRWAEALELERAIGRRQAARGGSHPAAPWRPGAAIALASLGERDEARRLAAEQMPIARKWGVPRAIGIALRAQGIAEGGEHGVALLCEACAVLAPTPARLEHARALIDYGAALRRANHRVDARAPLRTALDIAERCGAALLRDRAHAELLATGARPRQLVLTGVDSLTASERRVAKMAAAGMSNPAIAQSLFVTRSTVETHLRAIFRKLEISRREELTAMLGRDGHTTVAVSHS